MDMKFNFDLFLQILLVAACIGVVTMLFIQKTKNLIPGNNSKLVTVYSFVLNLVVGICFGLTFTNSNIIYAIWMGVFSFIGADQIYKSLENNGLVEKFGVLKNKNNNDTNISI